MASRAALRQHSGQSKPARIKLMRSGIRPQSGPHLGRTGTRIALQFFIVRPYATLDEHFKARVRNIFFRQIARSTGTGFRALLKEALDDSVFKGMER